MPSWGAWIVASAAGAAVALPAVWWEPLHLDERITLEFARGSVPTIVDEIFVERGGAPLHFLVERVTLSWPGGIEGLRLPSVLLFLLALPLAGLVARELAGAAEAALVPLVLALAPLTVRLATFGRMYTLFLAATLLAAWLCLRAAPRRERGRWIVAGVACGLLPYVHPLAPLYAVAALGGALALARSPRRRLLLWAGIPAAIAALPYLYALAVLRARYDVGEAGPLRGSGDRPASLDALDALAPGGTAGLVVFWLLAALGAWRLLGRRRHAGLVVLAWVLLPVVFFSLVPVGGTRFFDRYMLPALPFFLLLVVSGCLAVRVRVLAAVLLAGVVAWQAVDDSRRLSALADLELPELVRAVDAESVVFTATGFPTGRPPELLDDHLVLEVPEAERVDELPGVDLRFAIGIERLGCEEVRAFLASGQPGTGVWVFRAPPEALRRATRRLEALDGLEVERTGTELLLVRSRAVASPRALVELGLELREAWARPGPQYRFARSLAVVDRAALAGPCNLDD